MQNAWFILSSEAAHRRRTALATSREKVSANELLCQQNATLGVEWIFTPHWIIRGEYRYAGYGSNRDTFLSNLPVDSIRVRTDQSVHAMTIGISFLFN